MKKAEKRLIIGLIETVILENGKKYKVKIDTGADSSSIDESLVKTLENKEIVSHKIIRSALGRHRRPTMMVNLEFQGKEFHEKFTLEKLTLVHLNDSLVKLGSKKDRHALIGTGYIWGESTLSLATLCAICAKFSIPIVLETDPSDMDKMLRIFN